MLSTIGVNLNEAKHSKKNLTFTRRYLDPNRVTYEVRSSFYYEEHQLILLVQYHTDRKGASFDTAVGKSISKGMDKLAQKFDLSFTFGTAPHDFYLSRLVVPL